MPVRMPWSQVLQLVSSVRRARELTARFGAGKEDFFLWRKCRHCRDLPPEAGEESGFSEGGELDSAWGTPLRGESLQVDSSPLGEKEATRRAAHIPGGDWRCGSRGDFFGSRSGAADEGKCFAAIE